MRIQGEQLLSLNASHFSHLDTNCSYAFALGLPDSFEMVINHAAADTAIADMIRIIG